MKQKVAKSGYSIITDDTIFTCLLVDPNYIISIILSISIAELLSYSDNICGSAVKALIVIDHNIIFARSDVTTYTTDTATDSDACEDGCEGGWDVLACDRSRAV